MHIAVTPCARIAIIANIPEHAGFQVLEGPDTIIDRSGNLTLEYSKILARLFNEVNDLCKKS